VKEGAFWRVRAVRVFAVGGVLITAAAIALCTPWLGLVDLREVVISGNAHASAADLVSLSGLHRGQSLLTLSLRRIRSNLLLHPWVKHISLDRRLPHTLAIQVVEREEVAWMVPPPGDGCVTLAEGGVVVSADCDRSGSLIELRGARLSGVGVGAFLPDASIVRLVDALRGAALAFLATRRIDVTDPTSVEVEAGSGLRVLLGGLNDAMLRLDALVALYRSSLDLEDYEVVDLRFGGEATLVPR